jgi:hypothetical protein
MLVGQVASSPRRLITALVRSSENSDFDLMSGVTAPSDGEELGFLSRRNGRCSLANRQHCDLSEEIATLERGDILAVS